MQSLVSGLEQQYQECDKDGLHRGELKSIVVIDRTLQDNLICPICLETGSFPTSNTKPLKIFVEEIRHFVIDQEKDALNNQHEWKLRIAAMINENQHKCLQQIQQFKQQFLQQVDSTLNEIQNWHQDLIHSVSQILVEYSQLSE